MPAAPPIRLDSSHAGLPPLGPPPRIEASTLPAELLAEYQELRAKSIVGQIIAAARQMQERVDRVVLLGNAAELAPARALFQAGCHPYHNELSRGERAGYPRIYFVDERADNDAVQGLLLLLGNGRAPERLEDRWGLILCSPPDEADMSVKLKLLSWKFVSCLEATVDPSQFHQHVIRLQDEMPIMGLRTFALAGMWEAAPLSPLGLLPAALMGLDVLRYLQGANDLARQMQVGTTEENLAGRFVAIRTWLTESRDINGYELRWWDNSLASFAACMKQQLPADAGDAHSLRVNLIVARPRCDPLQFEDNVTASQLVDNEIVAAREADRAAGQPFVDIVLPSTQIGSLGQLFQLWLTIARGA